MLSGCGKAPYSSNQGSILSNNVETPYEIKINKDDYNFIIAQVDNHIYLGKLDNVDLVIRDYNIFEKSFSDICKIQNYMFSNNSIVELDGVLYFFVTTHENGKNTNHLYSIDTTTNISKKLYSESLYQTFNYLTVFNSSLLIVKGDLNNTDVITYIEKYDTSSEKRTTILSATANHNTKTGEIILNITSHNSNLFVYSEKYEAQQLHRYITVFDKDLNIIDDIKIESNEDNFFAQPINNFKVIENQFFLQNYSNASVFIEKNDPRDSTFYKIDDSFSVAHQATQKDKNIILFKRNTIDIFTLSPNGELNPCNQMDIDDNYVINNVTQDEKMVAVWFKDLTDSKKQKVYLYTYNDLFDQEIN